MQPWKTLDSLRTPAGVLELRQRGPRDFLITIAGRVLMTSQEHRSEEELAHRACAPLRGRARPRVLLGGLGMGYTLRATLDEVSRDARISVAELNPRVVAWCRGPLAELTEHAASDHRVSLLIDDVAHVIARAPAGVYDPIILDLYEGPHHTNNRGEDPLYGARALARARMALSSPGGVLAVWSEEPDAPFEARLGGAGFEVERCRVGLGGHRHIIYLGRADPRRLPRT